MTTTPMSAAPRPNAPADLDADDGVTGGRYLVTGGRVHRTPGAPAPRDLHVADGVITPGPSPGPLHVLDAAGADVVPLLVESSLAQLPPERRGGYDLVPGNPATFAVVDGHVGASRITSMLVVAPRDLRAVLVAGHVEVRVGAPTRPAGQDVADPAVAAQWLGAWHDPRRALVQHLDSRGRYSETRSGRVDAYTGRYWVRGGRITYLDDSGFWAFGELLDGVLHHAGFVMSRR